MNGPWGSGQVSEALVYGLGLSGQAATELLLAHGVGVRGIDGRGAAAAGELVTRDGFQLLSAEPVSDVDVTTALEGVDLVVVSPGVPPTRPLFETSEAMGIPVVAEVELAFPFLRGPVVAITGTNGKSTTTALTGALLRAAGHTVEVCGNIGRPLSACVDGAEGRVFVVELSSFQIEGLVTFRPMAAAHLNLTEDHLDRYGSLEAYAAAKARLFTTLETSATAVLNADDPIVAATATSARRRFFSRRGAVEDGCFATTEGSVLEVAPGQSLQQLFFDRDVPLAGVQNLENAMAAALLARCLDVPADALVRGLQGFRGLPHRLERVGERGGIAWFDDSKGTNPAATTKSLEGFADHSVHLILGGRNKGADLEALGPIVRQKARRLYLIGEAAQELTAALTGAAELEQAGTLDQAVRAAASRAAAGEVVVLSPACASFDQFRNFSHRGEVFQGLVKDIVLGGRHGEEARF
jgi:UDP-N-acetylmuramoylalanine--D-glutamate ligase